MIESEGSNHHDRKECRDATTGAKDAKVKKTVQDGPSNDR